MVGHDGHRDSRPRRAATDGAVVDDLVDRSARGMRSAKTTTRRRSSAPSSTRVWPGCTSRSGNGGLGLNPKLQKIVNERMFAAGAPEPVLPQPDRLRHVRPDGRGVGERGAEAALPAPAVHRRRDLVPAVQRAGRRLRLRRPVVDGRARRRRVDRQRAEGVDDAGAPVALGAAGRPHRPRGRRSTPASPRSSSTCTRPASRCGRCAR